MDAKKRMICETCGSEDVGRDAWAEWDFATQAWVLRGDPFDQGYCFNCDGETNIDEVDDGDPSVGVDPREDEEAA